MTTTVQQIVYSGHPERWHALAEALGFVAPSPPEPDWAEFDGGGVLAVHRETDDHPDGTVDLHLLLDDLDAAQLALTGRDSGPDMNALLPLIGEAEARARLERAAGA